ncbi:hypothetical protein DPMN_118724 [Dreissena polymorpha]|uniref:Uncharacterized protein n=1 Tax=Dreissena polymorpha TaxID=45954 RepID=A0A9D4GHC5_DREPO|nr:hypothetical protein DPMN_118724 [Dreissena polymorpha]
MTSFHSKTERLTDIRGQFALRRRAPQMLTVRTTRVTTEHRTASYTTGKMDTATVISQLSVPASHARLTTTVRETLVIMVLHIARSMTPVLHMVTVIATRISSALVSHKRTMRLCRYQVSSWLPARRDPRSFQL